MGDRVAVRRDDDILIIELVSPPKNVTDQLFFEEMAGVVELIEHADKIKGAIIAGMGRHFSSGADISELISTFSADGKKAKEELIERSLKVFQGIASLPYPVVAAIKGCCLGSGLELALACHYRIATRTALLAMPEMSYGIMPGCGGTLRLPRLIGVGSAIEMMFSGRSLLGEEALQLNLIDALAEKETLMARAKQMIDLHAGERL